jgi:hypothetical protein
LAGVSFVVVQVSSLTSKDSASYAFAPDRRFYEPSANDSQTKKDKENQSVPLYLGISCELAIPSHDVIEGVKIVR